MTVIVGIVAYIFGSLSTLFCMSLLVSGKKMDEMMGMDGEEDEQENY